MGRKRSGFEWVREDVDEVALEPVERRDRVAERALRDRLEAIALALIRRAAPARRRVPLEAYQQEALDVLAACGPTPARRRQLNRVIGLLRGADLDAIEAALAGDSPHERHIQDLERWRARLLAGGDEALHAFLVAFPGGDPQRLRQALREARGDGPRVAAAGRRLFQLLRAAGPRASEEEGPEGDDQHGAPHDHDG